MGAWGHEPFANDSALDWAGELSSAEDSSAILDALQVVVKNDDSIEVDERSAALAAAEVVAALKGKPHSGLPESVTSWIVQHHFQPHDALIVLALEAITRVEQSSELQELWEENNEYHLWRSTIADLRHRLQS